MRRAALGVVGFQAAAWLLIAAFGFATSPPSWALAATQTPGVLLLSELGWCCGTGGGFVNSDAILDRWGGPSAAGAPVLAAANTVVLLALVVPAAALIARGRRRAASGRVLEADAAPRAS